MSERVTDTTTACDRCGGLDRRVDSQGHPELGWISTNGGGSDTSHGVKDLIRVFVFDWGKEYQSLEAQGLADCRPKTGCVHCTLTLHKGLFRSEGFPQHEDARHFVSEHLANAISIDRCGDAGYPIGDINRCRKILDRTRGP